MNFVLVFVDTLLDELTEEQRHSCPNEYFFAGIAQNFETIYILGANLKFTVAEIEKFEAYRPHSVPTQAIKMLSIWRDRDGIEATVERLIKAMERSRIPEHCYKDSVLEFFREFYPDDSYR